MIEQAYNAQVAAHWHWIMIRVGMLRAGVRDGDVGLYAALWFELRLEAERDLMRATEQIKEVQKGIYV